jgi:hypothetical protein
MDDFKTKLEEAHSRDPRDYPFGVFQSDVLGGGGGGIGLFSWYRDASTLLDAVTDQFPAIHQDPEDESSGFSETVLALRETRKGAKDPDKLTEEQRAAGQNAWHRILA